MPTGLWGPQSPPASHSSPPQTPPAAPPRSCQSPHRHRSAGPWACPRSNPPARRRWPPTGHRSPHKGTGRRIRQTPRAADRSGRWSSWPAQQRCGSAPRPCHAAALWRAPCGPARPRRPAGPAGPLRLPRRSGSVGRYSPPADRAWPRRHIAVPGSRAARPALLGSSIPDTARSRGRCAPPSRLVSAMTPQPGSSRLAAACAAWPVGRPECRSRISPPGFRSQTRTLAAIRPATDSSDPPPAPRPNREPGSRPQARDRPA